jgi:hypothetical protein
MERSRLLVTVPAEQGLRQATGSLITTLGKIQTMKKLLALLAIISQLAFGADGFVKDEDRLRDACIDCTTIYRLDWDDSKADYVVEEIFRGEAELGSWILKKGDTKWMDVIYPPGRAFTSKHVFVFKGAQRKSPESKGGGVFFSQPVEKLKKYKYEVLSADEVSLVIRDALKK